jgi:hypothetical protein
MGNDQNKPTRSTRNTLGEKRRRQQPISKRRSLSKTNNPKIIKPKQPNYVISNQFLNSKPVQIKSRLDDLSKPEVKPIAGPISKRSSNNDLENQELKLLLNKMNNDNNQISYDNNRYNREVNDYHRPLNISRNTSFDNLQQIRQPEFDNNYFKQEYQPFIAPMPYSMGAYQKNLIFPNDDYFRKTDSLSIKQRLNFITLE